MQKKIILLLQAAACAVATASLAQTTRPGAVTDPSKDASVWILGEGNTSCAEVSRVVAQERTERPKDAPKNSVAVAKYAMLAMFADGVWTAMNTMAGPITGERKINHLVGEYTEFDDRMQMFNSYCSAHPDVSFYSAALAVRRDIVNKN